MKLKIDFSKLVNARESIGASIADIKLNKNKRNLPKNSINFRPINVGKVILSTDQLKNILKHTSGVFEGFTLHIYHPRASKEILSKNPAEGPKFHVWKCRTLKSMEEKGRYDRYVKSEIHEIKDGLFLVEPSIGFWSAFWRKKRGEKILARLHPCKNCLQESDYENYRNSARKEQERIIKDFDVEYFFNLYKDIHLKLKKPKFTKENFPQGNYPENWNEISKQKREENDWKCSCCNVSCKESKNLLHTHHIDGNPGHIDGKNLKVICKLCHKSQPFHSTMHISKKDKIKIHDLRESQGKNKICDSCKE